MMRSNTNTCFIMKLTFVAAEHLHYDLSAVTFLKKLDRMKEINNQVFNMYKTTETASEEGGGTNVKKLGGHMSYFIIIRLLKILCR